MHGYQLEKTRQTREHMNKTYDEDEDLDGLLDDDEPADPNPNNGGDGSPKLPGAVKKVITKLRDDRRTLREENERLKNDPRLKEPVNPTPPTPANGGQGEPSDVAKLTFAQQHKELDWEDIENAFAISAMKKVPTAEALNDPLFVAYKEKKDASKKVNDATPPPSNRSSVLPPQGKSMKDLTDAERRAMQDKIIEENRRKR